MCSVAQQPGKTWTPLLVSDFTTAHGTIDEHKYHYFTGSSKGLLPFTCNEGSPLNALCYTIV